MIIYTSILYTWLSVQVKTNRKLGFGARVSRVSTARVVWYYQRGGGVAALAIGTPRIHTHTQPHSVCVCIHSISTE